MAEITVQRPAIQCDICDDVYDPDHLKIDIFEVVVNPVDLPVAGVTKHICRECVNAIVDAANSMKV